MIAGHEYIAVLNETIPPLPAHERCRVWLPVGQEIEFSDGSILGLITEGQGEAQRALFVLRGRTGPLVPSGFGYVTLEQLAMVLPNVLARAMVVDAAGIDRVLLELGVNASRPDLRRPPAEAARC